MKVTSIAVAVVAAASARICAGASPLGLGTPILNATANVAEARKTLFEYLEAKEQYEEAVSNLIAAEKECTKLTATFDILDAKYNKTQYEADQAAAYADLMLDAYNDAVAMNATAAQRTRYEDAANATYYKALEASTAASEEASGANTTRTTAETNMNDKCDANATCPSNGADSECVGSFNQTVTTKKGTFDTKKYASVNDSLIPAILDETLNFPYEDSDGDLVPDKHDACPTQRGLRREAVAINAKLGGTKGVAYNVSNDKVAGGAVPVDFGSVQYAAGVAINTVTIDGVSKTVPVTPGPQDFCPSGCPETNSSGAVMDSDKDGFPDCEDRCPFEVGIAYNHRLYRPESVSGTDVDGKTAYYTSEQLNQMYPDDAFNGCPDFDGDRIPDLFDHCPGSPEELNNTRADLGPLNSCYSGCPDPGNASDGNPYDLDMDGVIDCIDRCPGMYAPNTTDGCPDYDLDGVPDYRDYCPANPGTENATVYWYNRKLEDQNQALIDLDNVGDTTLLLGGATNPTGGAFIPATGTYDPSNSRTKFLGIHGCPDKDGDLVPDPADYCNDPTYPNQASTNPARFATLDANNQQVNNGTDDQTLRNIDGVVVVDNAGCPIDSDADGVFDGIDMCDGTVHSKFDIHDPYAKVYTVDIDGYPTDFNDNVLGCPSDTDGDGVVDGIDQCPKEGGKINEDGCPLDGDGDGVKDCISTKTLNMNLYSWPLTLGDSAGNTTGDICHTKNATYDYSSVLSGLATACCDEQFDNCPATPKFVTVNTEKEDPLVVNPQTVPPSGQGCSVDSDGDGIHDGKDRCPYTTPTEIALFNETAYPNITEYLAEDDYGCTVTLPKAWDMKFIDLTVTTGLDNSTDNITDFVDRDGDANPDIQLLFSLPEVNFLVQESRGQQLPPNITQQADVNSQSGLPLYRDNDFITARVLDYNCENAFDDTTMNSTTAGPMKKLLPTAIFRGFGAYKDKGDGDKDIPEGDSPFYVDLEVNPDDAIGSEIYFTTPPYDTASIEFCVRVDLYSDSGESVTFSEMKTSLTIDLSQGFKITGTEVKRNNAGEETSFLDVQYPIEACFCDLQNNCRGPGFGSSNTNDDNFLLQDEAMRVCVRFDPTEPSFPPAYVKFSDMKSFACDQGSLIHRPISNFMRAGDGLTSVSITNDATDYNGRIIVLSTKLPSAFYSIESNTVDCFGVFVMDFTADAPIGAPIPVPAPVTRRMTTEVSIPIGTTNMNRELDIQQAESEFSLQIALEAVEETTKASNIGLIAGLSVAGAAVIIAGALIVSRTLPAMGIRKKSNRAESLTLDESLTDSSRADQAMKGCIA